MSQKNYTWCAVPLCKSSAVKTPEKLFIKVPSDKKMRKKWLELSRRDPKLVSQNTRLFFCEDHFDLENDMENYMQYRLLGSVKRIRMKPNCMPSKFHCQPDRRRTLKEDKPRAAFVKRQRLALLEEVEKALKNKESTAVPIQQDINEADDTINIREVKENTEEKENTGSTKNKSVQVYFPVYYRSKLTQTKIQTQDRATSP